jgi:anion transporter
VPTGSAPLVVVTPPGKPGWGLAFGVLAMVIVMALPLGAGLPAAGQRMLAILAFAVVVWITEAVSYETSAIIIATLMAFLVGTAPVVNEPTRVYGTSRAIGMALAGFANPALALVGGALFIAAAMTLTGLDRRIALHVLARVGTSTSRILIGTIAVTVLLSLVVPSGTARSACVVPIMLGVIAAFGVNRRSNLAAAIMIVVAQATSIWNVGIPTATAQNLLTLGFMDKMLGARVTWAEWLIAGAPWAVLMSVVLFFTVRWLLPAQEQASSGNKDAVLRELAALGPMPAAQKRLMAVALGLLAAWASEGKLHHFDTTSTTYVGLVVLLLPRIGVMSFKDVQKHIPWGTLIVFGVGISLGTALLSTQAGQWLAQEVIRNTGLERLGTLGVLAVLCAFLIVIHLGFASATALTSALMPILISVLAVLPGDFNRLGMTMVLGYAVSFGFLLPINAPQNMVCLGTDTFTARQFARIGIVLTLAGYALLLVFAMTWWRWLGWL